MEIIICWAKWSEMKNILFSFIVGKKLKSTSCKWLGMYITVPVTSLINYKFLDIDQFKLSFRYN